MKNCKWLVFCLALTVALFSASASYGAPPTVLIGAGSSALFPSVGLAAITGDPITGSGAVCGSQFWTGGSGSASSIATGTDSRGGGIHAEPGTLWVAWDNDLAPTKVCAFLSVDSVVGSRLFLERNATGVNGSLALAATAQYTLGGNKVSFAQDSLSCSAAGPLAATVSLSAAGSTVTATVFGGGNFGPQFANGAKVTVTGSSVPADNVTNVAVAGVGSYGPVSFTYTAAGAANDVTGDATATVAANCPGVPPAVYAALVATPNFTVGFTDIRPEDGVFAYHRANDLGDYPAIDVGNMDYNGTGIRSSYSQGVAFPVNFNLTGADPISGFTPLPAVVVQSIGAEPVMIITNNTDVTACGTGNPAFTNVTTDALARAYMGLAGATRDLDPSLGPCLQALWPVEREPLSGTYNTFEWQVLRTVNNPTQHSFSQEVYNTGYPGSPNGGLCAAAWAGVLPASVGATTTFPANPPNPGNNFNANNCGNPLNIQIATYPNTPLHDYYSGFGGNRTRAIGTGELVNVINGGSGGSANTADSIGYAFYSLGTFGGKAKVKYLTLDGVDPLWTSYGSNPYAVGTFPACTGFVNTAPVTFNCPLGQPNFAGVASGSYKVWEPLHAIYDGAAPGVCVAPFNTLTIACLIQAAQDQAVTNVKDFVPVQICPNAACGAPVSNFNFYRSHYQNAGPAPNNGNNNPGAGCANVEAGGDMAGQIYPKQTDYTLQANFGCGAGLTSFFL